MTFEVTNKNDFIYHLFIGSVPPDFVYGVSENKKETPTQYHMIQMFFVERNIDKFISWDYRDGSFWSGSDSDFSVSLFRRRHSEFYKNKQINQ